MCDCRLDGKVFRDSGRRESQIIGLFVEMSVIRVMSIHSNFITGIILLCSRHRLLES